MHQVGKTPVDIQILNNSHCPIDRFLIAELERGGNLKGPCRVLLSREEDPGGHVGSFQRVVGDDQSGDFCSGNDDMGFEKESGGVTL
ncbi:hypothetical protein OIU79_005619 [Salix purpurea]|uniref:Uncharacterized protein n=1 Tax=Salix purpurea TaxID=77065 RepID=A0A9Q0TTC1_SALPP|nr:hypothetical protein OIU79_005619 [Salix purpurea]